MNKLIFDTQNKNYQAHFQKQLDALLEYNKDFENKDFNDIHIYQEDAYIVLEWERVRYKENKYVGFEFINEDQVVMLERTFPDNHTELCYSEDDYKERFEEFLKENPGWTKTSYGTWTNTVENEQFLKDLQEEIEEEQ